MATDSEEKIPATIEEALGIDYESEEWKAGVIAYNNRGILKHDITSKKLLKVRRLLRDGNIGLLDKDNQALLADFLDLAIQEVPKKNKKRGKPQNDKINTIKLMKHLSYELERLHHEGLTIDAALSELACRRHFTGKYYGTKRIEQLCYNYRSDQDYYDNELHNLYYSTSGEMWRKYMILVGNEGYIEELSALDDCRLISFEGPQELFIAEKERRAEAIHQLSVEYGITEDGVEERIMWQEDWPHTEDGVAHIRQHITKIATLPEKMGAVERAEIKTFISRLESLEIDCDYMWLMQEARFAKAETLGRLKEMQSAPITKDRVK